MSRLSQALSGESTPGIDIGTFVRGFFDREAVLRRLPPAVHRALSRGGALTRTIARQSIRPARRLSLSEMTPTQRQRHQATLRRIRRQGGRRPKRPYAPAVPYRPPRNKTGALRDRIFFAYDTSTDRMLIGPAIHRAGTAWLLEHGGTARLPNSRGFTVRMTFRGNPFMAPALDKAEERLPDLFRNVISF